MNKFLFKSADTDLQKLITIQMTVQKNVLYITHRVDLIIRELNELKVNKGLQKQVDEYFDEDTENIPQVEKEPEHTDHL